VAVKFWLYQKGHAHFSKIPFCNYSRSSKILHVDRESAECGQMLLSLLDAICYWLFICDISAAVMPCASSEFVIFFWYWFTWNFRVSAHLCYVSN